jgi:cyclopropane fatty-acyl-phospholipid synthase-like methyltransferase
MFEHMKNYEFLLKKVSTWLKSGGKLFVHIFCHQSDPYDMEKGISVRGSSYTRLDEYVFFHRGNLSLS